MHHPDDETRTWDAIYAGDGDDVPMWSGAPNAALVAEVVDLTPSTALDVGCGEGADAIWLAARGWQVTAIDPSGVALDRARAAARAAGVEVTWMQTGLLGMPEGPGTHDLVTAQYAVLRRTPDDAAIRALLAAVAPGGTLLVVHHDLDGTDRTQHAHECHVDPADHVAPADVAARLDDGWEIEMFETRPRPRPLPPEARHVRDVVLRARRIRPAPTTDR